MHKIENVEETSKDQVETMQQYIIQLENKLKKSEKELEKEKHKRIQAEGTVIQLKKEIKILRSKEKVEIEPPSFDLKITQEIEKMRKEKEQQDQNKPSEATEKSPAVHEKMQKKPSSLVLRVKKRQRRSKIDSDCQYEIVCRKTKKNVDNENQKQQFETKEGQKENTNEQKQEEQNEESDYEHESETETDEQVRTTDNEEIIDVDGYSQSSKTYKSKDITKSSILQLLNEEQQNKILTFFNFNKNEK